VATTPIKTMQRWIEPHKISYITQGIDTDRFRPEPHFGTDGLRVLIVGEHMRDWLVIHRAIDDINHRGLDVEFLLVTDERIFPYFNGCAYED
jgi:hypothetical protein